jgi:hypothetical protein
MDDDSELVSKQATSMTIEAWNIVLSVVILVLLTSGGIWLKYVVDQQLKSKDTAIQALEGVVKLKDAQIASLEGNTAPAIVKAYADMRQYADQTTEDYQNVLTRYGEVTSKLHFSTQLVPAQTALHEAHGLNRASDILHKHIDELLFPGGKPNPLLGAETFDAVICKAVLNAGCEIASKSSKCSRNAGKIIEPLLESLEAR